jgi:hypothetical protein
MILFLIIRPDQEINKSLAPLATGGEINGKPEQSDSLIHNSTFNII